MTSFEVVLVERFPQSSGAPTMIEIDRLVVEGLSYTEELNRPGSANLGCPVESMTDNAKERLADLAAHPSEVWIYYGSELVWAGEVQTVGIQGQSVQLNCAGLLGYTHRMGVTTDLTYTGIDQFTIAKGLVDHWQSLSYGNYGIDTSGVSTSGVTRDRVYLRDELNPIGQRLQELGAVLNGFDMYVDPATREFVLSYPQRGLDLTASVFLDTLNIVSASVSMSVGPDDLVSDISATGTSQAGGVGSTIYTERSTTSLRTAYGRSWGSESFDGVSVLSTLEGHADAFLAVRTGQFFQPGVVMRPRVGADITDFTVGDTVSYSFDAGLGLQSGTFRIAKRTVSAAADGGQQIRVEFT